jgi:pyruvate/2-oxoglutarate dehydrogenase complex dihydrolipoamide acyltransferase (E2) component
MTWPIHAPRINNNDDQVRLSAIFVEPGAAVRTGDPLVDVETDKSTFTVEAEREGYVLAVSGAIGEMIDVGAVLVWMGESASDSAPASGKAGAAQTSDAAPPTAKALDLLRRHGIEAAAVPFTGARLTAADVEAWVALHPSQPVSQPTSQPVPVAAKAPAVEGLPPGESLGLTLEERGMLRSVLFHRDEAVPAYLELAGNHAEWQEFSARFGTQHRLLLSPLLGLLAHQLARYAVAHPKLNSAMVESRRYQYSQVNMGFTVQSGETLYLVSVRDAQSLTPLAFVQRLQGLQRKAMGHKLGPEELGGATIGFTSMERWKVSRHIPVLPPHVSLMVAHTANAEGRMVLGATYDHRILTGADVVLALTYLSKPQGMD